MSALFIFLGIVLITFNGGIDDELDLKPRRFILWLLGVLMIVISFAYASNWLNL
jgi:hypothetical protein